MNKNSIIEKILNSSEFKDSKRYQELLLYLVDATEKNIHVKEISIAADLFEKNTGFDPHDDPTVRVYISNLRKKLQHYYLTEGKEDKIRLNIPKGQYHVNFVPFKIRNNKNAVNYKNLTYFFFVPLSLILLSIILFQKSSIEPDLEELSFSQTHPVWGEFMSSNENPTMVVIGDYLFLYERKPGKDGGYFVRDPRINSPDEYKRLIKQDPKLIERFVLCDFTYLAPSAAESMVYILPILLSAPNKVYLKLSSELTWEDLKSYNIIFVGTLKTLYELNKLVSNFSFKYQMFPPQIYMLNNNVDTVKTFSSTHYERTSYKKDIGIIVKHSGPDNNTIMLLTGFDELGVIESVKTVTETDFIDQMKSSHQNFDISLPFHFELFIEAEGVDRYTFNSTIKNFRIFDTDKKKWMSLQ